MCSNFETITTRESNWVQQHFNCELPFNSWREEIYPNYSAPFIWLENGAVRCDLAQFGLVPPWAENKKKFGLKTYNARSETVAEKPSYRNAWRRKQFGLAIMRSFYEPNYATGKAVRWRIKRRDQSPLAVASIWERFVDTSTGEILFSFSMLTLNASSHPVMQQFHKLEDEKRSIVVLQDQDYLSWLQANTEQARNLLQLAPANFLRSEAAPRI